MVTERVGPRERTGIRKRRVARVSAELYGEIVVKRFSKEDGSFLGEMVAPNTIQTAGKNLFLDLIAAISTDWLDNGTDLVIKDSGGATVASFTSTDSGYPTHDEDANNDPRANWRWSDISVDEYTPNTLEIKSPAGVVFSIVDVSGLGWGSKPDSENWRYTYRLIVVTSDPIFEDGTTGAWDGFDLLVQMVTGSSATYFGSTTRVAIYNSSWTEHADSPLTVDAAPTRSGQTLTYVFTASETEVESFEWYNMEVKTFGNEVLRKPRDAQGNNDVLGTKGSNEIWEWTYQFSI